MAEVPAPTLIGVQRVVLSCEMDSSLSPDQGRTLCAQLVRKAQSATSLPVREATAADRSPADLTKLSEQLLLQVSVRATPAKDNRKLLELTVTPVRIAVKQGQVGGLESTASLVEVAGEWIVQGHVDAFQQLLGGAPRKLHRPVHSGQ